MNYPTISFHWRDFDNYPEFDKYPSFHQKVALKFLATCCNSEKGVELIRILALDAKRTVGDLYELIQKLPQARDVISDLEKSLF